MQIFWSIPFGKKHFVEKSLLEPHGRVLSYLLINWVKFNGASLCFLLMMKCMVKRE
jgi:hypothetical protein